MFLALSSLTYDADGARVFDMRPDSDWQARPRRVSRSATLDGGAVLYHGGIGDADRTWDLEIRASRADWSALIYLHGTYAELRIALPDGVYRGAIETLDYDGVAAKLKFLPVEKLSA